jgi:hypothetical protein
MKKKHIDSTPTTLAFQALKQPSFPTAPLLPCCHTQIIRVTNTPIATDHLPLPVMTSQDQCVLHAA